MLIAANGHPMIFEAMRDARRRGVTTAFAVRGYGYDRPSYFADVDHVFTCSAFLSGVYRDTIGLVSTPLEPPLDWSTVVAPVESRAFVTFVNPAPHKGLFLFARLADMLGSRRPDIPVLVVQSGQSGGSLNNIPGIDFSRYPQLMAAPPVQDAARVFRVDADSSGAVGVGGAVRPRRCRGHGQRHPADCVESWRAARRRWRRRTLAAGWSVPFLSG